MTGNFKIIVIIFFMIAAVAGILVFSGAIPIGDNKDGGGAQGTVVLWGTAKDQIVNSLLNDFNRLNPAFIVKYIEKPAETFDEDVLEALATGKGPDMFFISDDLLYKYSNKIFTIPYQSLPLSTFQGAFVGAGNVFLTSKGVFAFPMTVDPMMMYYNKNMLDTNGITHPPSYWDEFSNLIPILNKKDENGKLVKSTVALGQFTNVLHAKDILSTLFLQTGNPIVSEKKDSYISNLDNNQAKFNLEPVLKFYTNFTDPLNISYSWNRSFPNSADAFSREDLAFYFGFASELKSLINKNPNQNIGVAPIPQIKNNNFKSTFAHVSGIAISSSSKNLNAAFSVGSLLSKDDFVSKFADSFGVVPARRDLIKANPEDAYATIFYESALFAKSWLDPSPKDTHNLFKDMVDKILSNSMSASQALKDADSKLGFLLLK